MNWTTETPTKLGFYWFKTSKNWIPTIVEVTEDQGRIYGEYIGDEMKYRLPWHEGGQQWMGPLEIPRD